MGTRSRIGISNVDGSITSIYCHWDGYPSHNGWILRENYNDEDKIRDLVSLGDISILAENINPSEGVKHTFDNPAAGVVVAYHRDRNETLQYDTFADEDAYSDFGGSCEEWRYLFKNGKWFVCSCYQKSKGLVPLTKKIINSDSL